MTACQGPHLLCSSGLEAVEPVGVVQVAHIAPNLHQLLHGASHAISRDVILPQCTTLVRLQSSSCS